MRYAHALLALAALLGVAGCQSDLEMRNLNRNGAYAASVWETEGFSFESDTRMVILDFQQPPIGHIVDSDTYIGYISIPLHPKRGLLFTNPSFGVGWSDVGMSVGGIFDPTPDKLPHGRRVKIVTPEPEDDDIMNATIRARTALHEMEVDPRYLEYAQSLRESLYRLELAGRESPPPLRPTEEADDD
jgi:hypothetical protein